MKKLILTLLLVAATGAANAQVHFNPIVGVNTFFLSTDPPSATSDVTAGWTIGLNLRTDGLVFFQPGIHYMSMHNGVQFDVSGGGAQYRDDISMLRIPLLAGVGFGPLNIHGGISPSIMLSATDHNTGADKMDVYNSFQAAFTVGGGIQILLLTLDVDLDFGITNVYSKPETVYGTTYDGTLSGVRVNLGLMF
jgi:hypothetical protein